MSRENFSTTDNETSTFFNHLPGDVPQSNDQSTKPSRSYIELLSNTTVNSNITLATSTTNPFTTTSKSPVLPPEGSQEQEKHYSLTIFFILFILAVCICLVHLLLQTKFNYLPDSIVIVLIGMLVGLIMKVLELKKVADWKTEESFPPTMFFLVLLPPIIFESGYNLHKGNFFQNIGTIMLFSIFGTCISALFVGGSIFLLGKIDLVYNLSLVQSFAFGSLISAVDPVATLAIFHAIKVDEVLYMLVFGESVLNDAVSIVLTDTVIESSKPAYQHMSGFVVLFVSIGRFCMMFFASAAIGAVTGLLSSLFLKFVDLRKTPSLEFAMIMIFSYSPYALAEGLHLSGIMAILFCGVVMSHYTHLNLSPICQIATQLTFRTVAFVAETCVFAYLGLAIFSFPHVIKPSLVIWSIVLILIGRAINILPLSYLANNFREHKITPKMQFIMWFSGLRGAVAFALSLHLELPQQEPHHVIVSTTLIVVIFTIICLGGSTMPLLKYLNRRDEKAKKIKRTESRLTLSKTKEMGEALDSEYYSELTEDEDLSALRKTLKGFAKFDANYFVPFFTRSFTKQEVQEGQRHMTTLLRKWHSDVREEEEEEENDEDDDHENFHEITTNLNETKAASGTNNFNHNTQDIELGTIEKVNTYDLLFSNDSKEYEGNEKNDIKPKWLKVRKKKESPKGKKTLKSETSATSNLPSQTSLVRLSDLFDDDDEDDIFSEKVRLVKKT